MARTNRTFGYTTERERTIVKDLQTLANIGPAMADDLLRLGMETPSDLATRDPEDLYDQLCALDGKRHDPCVLDTFMAAIDEADGNPAKPWWTYTAGRKRQQAARSNAANAESAAAEAIH